MFWDYFKNTLKYRLILKGGALTVFAKAVAACLHKAYNNILWLREQFFPETCELQYLDLHGQARGLTRAPIETNDMWRKRVIHAAAWHKLAGKRKGLEKILEQSGYPGTKEIKLSGERWAEFVLNVPRPESMSVESWDHIIWLANEYKRATAKLASVVIRTESKASFRTKTAALYGTVCRVYPLSVTAIKQDIKVYAAVSLVPGYMKLLVRPKES